MLKHQLANWHILILLSNFRWAMEWITIEQVNLSIGPKRCEYYRWRRLTASLIACCSFFCQSNTVLHSTFWSTWFDFKRLKTVLSKIVRLLTGAFPQDLISLLWGNESFFSLTGKSCCLQDTVSLNTKVTISTLEQ